LINYWLTGEKYGEFTFATTTQCYNPRMGGWDNETLKSIGIPTEWFPPIIQPGTFVGEYHKIPVIAPACHDTGSAVVAVPTTTPNFAYLSSGTWSLIGLEVNEPVINDDAYEANVTNEGGVAGTFRLLKNVMGLWLIQQCQATWQAQGVTYSYDRLMSLAAEAEPFAALIDPDDPSFLAPGDMPTRIRAFCQKTQQSIPRSEGQILRTVCESLALKYRYVLDKMLALTGRHIERLHIIGGGTQNTLLCQMTADAIGHLVITGPIEATALGNAIVQYIALGELDNIEQARHLLSMSLDTRVYEPTAGLVWEEQYQRFKELLG
jgi:rhamnulokinase